MKKIILTLMMFFVLSSNAQTIYSSTCIIDGIQYSVNHFIDKGNGIESYYAVVKKCSLSGDIVIPESIEYERMKYSVTSIGEYAFQDCSSLTSVTIPNSVTSIGNYAFEGCSSLTSVTIPNSVTSIGNYAFEGCNSLTSITIPDSVTYINYRVFKGCSSLASVTIGNSVTSINGSAFEGCSSLTSIIIPNSVTSIGTGAFKGCSSLTSVTIGNSVTYINTGAFEGCNRLTSITLDCLIIKAWFRRVDSIKEISIGNNVTSIEDNAFSDCSSLTSVTIPNSVTKIGDYAFYNCSSLTSIIIPNSVTSIGTGVFRDCSSLTSVTIPNSVTSIGSSAFEGCSSLTSVAIPNSVTEIGYDAFKNCSSLTSVTIPNSVTSIGSSAFEGCSSLTSVTIPNSVTSIGNYAFRGCSIKELRLLAKNPPALNVFVNDIKGSINKVEVPYGCAFAYGMDAEWCKIDTIYTVNNGKKLYLAMVGNNDILNVSNGGSFYEFEEGTEITITPKINDFYKEALITHKCIDITETLRNKRTFSFKVSPKHERNIKIHTFGDKAVRTISLEKEGELINKMSVEEIQSISQLSISGNLNGTDILTIRKMTNLKMLDMRNAKIVNGGLSYYEDYVTSENIIGPYFFKDKTTLEKIILPSSTTHVNNGAFDNCTHLKSIIVPNLVEEADLTTADGSIFLEDGDTPIKLYFGCAKGVYFGRSFNDCPNPKNQKEELYVEISNNVTKIGDDAFHSCRSLTSVTIPNSVTSIGDYAFQDCSSLTSVTIPNSVTSIGHLAFYGCSSLTSVTIGNSLTKIQRYTFGKCSSLTSVTIGNSVTEIGDYAFRDCSSLTSVTIPNSVTKIGSFAFYDCSGLTSVIIGNGVTSTGYYAFCGCSSLTSVTIPNSVTSIYGSFSGCSSLTSVTIPNSVTEIGYSAFSGCSSLTSIIIPNSVTSIDEYAFSGCSSLTSITSLNTTPPEIRNSTFDDNTYSNAELNIPKGSKTLYWLHPYWENFFNMKEIDVTGIDNNVMDYPVTKKGVIHNLKGERVKENSFDLRGMPKGIYIIKGKKVIIK